MDRREAVRRLAAAGLATAVTPAWVDRLVAGAESYASTRQHHGSLQQAVKPWQPLALTVQQNAAVIAIAELIVPATDTPGATAARVNEFIDAVIDDARDAEKREFLDGLAWMDARSRELFGADFVGCTPDQQTALLTIVSSEKNTAMEDRAGVAFFKAIKALTITGYYTSDVGMREALGDDGVVFFADDPGCGHPEHQKG